ncbi:Serine/threonine-protein kinase PrkC [Anatilimnocola aggregata]|uniref:Serine/threonine-protein kinase PrkC n=1 Tax=Anatilimnocola aggregata TaxID=2528021 RepID=A0A517YHK3_9BACT|nr:serine/threonine-protein kinase [Anatilimnocola aggregata]QDU29720.1 Serine/threonine-protein kinase PrkC [Anatilimnocola aggregata]
MPSLLRSAPAPARTRPDARLLPTIPGYELVKRLAVGNQFELFRARPAGPVRQSSADYVIKSIRSDVADRSLARAILQREALVATSLAHPHLISVFNYQLGEHESDVAYLVLPYAPGQTLRNLITQGAKVPVPQALWYVRQTAEALGALHGGGWLHGDVKPENLIVSDQGHVTLIDLGLARRLESGECHTGTWLAGDAAYLPPEAFLSGYQLTAAADIYSLGLTLLHLLRGAVPNSPAPLLDNWHAAQDLRVSRPDVSREVATLIAKLTSTEPIRRPLVSELLATLSRLEIESLMQW